MIREGYDVAQICSNGHVANSTTQNMPEFNEKFCATCGAATITNCPACNAPIRGSYWGGGIGVTYVAPRFCINCGEPFPWTRSRIEAAGALAKELDSIDEEDRAVLKNSIDDLVRDAPSTQVAATRFKKIMAKAGSSAASMFRDLLTDVLSETAKKILWP
ncbi:MAG: DUF2321 domain-containing protein [Bacteroidia bacterium]|nr:DUF2321 domain-containing protein [Bacteroidia bacterium]